MLATRIAVGLSFKAWEATSIGDRFNDYFVFDEDESILVYETRSMSSLSANRLKRKQACQAVASFKDRVERMLLRSGRQV